MAHKLQSGTTQKIALGAASVASTAFGKATYAIRVVATGNCHIETGPAPTATASSAYIAANQRGETFAVNPEEKIAVIQDASATGDLYVTELTR